MDGAPIVPTAKLAQSGDNFRNGAFGMILGTLIFLGIAIIGIGALLFVRGRAKPEVEYHFFRCESCNQKIRYLASKKGNMGMCPRCRRRCLLTPSSQDFLVDCRAGEAYQIKVGARRPRPDFQSNRPHRSPTRIA
jgi:hypothetical protein